MLCVASIAPPAAASAAVPPVAVWPPVRALVGGAGFCGGVVCWSSPGVVPGRAAPGWFGVGDCPWCRAMSWRPMPAEPLPRGGEAVGERGGAGAEGAEGTAERVG